MTPKDNVALICNPVGGSGKGAALLKQFSPPPHVDVLTTTAKGDAIMMARTAYEKGARSFIAVGGDGTFNEVVCGLMQARADAPHAHQIDPPLLSLVRAGTGSDLARTLNAHATIQEGFDALAKGGDPCDVGEIRFSASGTVRHFINIADCGLGGLVVRRVNRGLKRGPARAIFFYHSLMGLLKYRANVVTVHANDTTFAAKVDNLVIANGRYFGGGMFVAPKASPTDGEFMVVVFRHRPALWTMLNMRHLYNGSHLSLPSVSSFNASTLRVEGGDGIWFDIDGEEGEQPPATLTCLHHAVRIAQ